MAQADSNHTTKPLSALDATLREKFARLYRDIQEFRPTFEALEQRRDAEIVRRTGIPSHWTFRTDEECTRHLEAMRIADRETGFQAANTKMEELWRCLDPVVKAIISTPAQDLAGLALKANAVATAWGSLWEQTPEDLDHEKELLRDLIENVCAVAGVDLEVNKRIRPRAGLN
jgi:hypothetical protein